MRVAAVIELSNEERTRLEAFARGRSTPARLVLRARIVLRAAKGIQNKEIARELKTQEKTVVSARLTARRTGPASSSPETWLSGRP
jgi:DNA-binding CsgD family transcriptional regulator